MADAQSKKTILIVDDDRFLLDMYSLKFREASFEVEVAASGEEALEKLTQGFEPSVILLDIVMPTLNGLEVLARIHQEKLAPKSVIIVLSNQGQAQDIEAAKKAGIDGYIIKASTIPSEVLDRVGDILEAKGPSKK